LSGRKGRNAPTFDTRRKKCEGGKMKEDTAYECFLKGVIKGNKEERGVKGSSVNS